MRNLIITLILATLVALPALADRNTITGGYASSSGAFVVVGQPDQNESFIIKIYSGKNGSQLVAQPRASFFDGPNFSYTIGGDQIVGTYYEQTGQVKLTNRSGSWTSVWRRQG